MRGKYNTSLRLVQLQNQKKFKILLKLPVGERAIGLLDLIDTEGIFLTRRNIAHLFRKSNSLGINHQLLTSDDIRFRWIVIDFAGEKLITTRQYYLAKGKVLKFGQQGFEPQVFLPLSEFGKDKALAFEHTLPAQPSLFTTIHQQ